MHQMLKKNYSKPTFDHTNKAFFQEKTKRN